MEITECTGRKIVIELQEHEYNTLQKYCNMVFLDVEDIIHLFFRSLYNFIVQYLMVKGEDGY